MIEINAPITVNDNEITAPITIAETTIDAPIDLRLPGPPGPQGPQGPPGEDGSGGGTVPFENTVEVTYAGLVTLINTDAITAGTFYEITDYRTINDAGGGHVSTGPGERLIVQGTSVNTISAEAFSPAHKKDELKYDITLDGIVSQVSGEWEDNTSVGDDDITITNWQPSSFDMDQEPILDDDFYIYAETDAGDEIEYEASGLGSDFTITDLGGGLYRITDLGGSIDFTDPDYNYMEANFNTKIVSRNGYITYRKDTEKNISANYDFRNCRYARYLVDVSGVAAYDSGTTYNANIPVLRNNHIYVSMAGNNHNNDPASKPTMWCLALKNIATEYYSGQNSIKIGGRYLNRRDDQFVLLHTFSKKLTSPTFEFNTDKAANVDIFEEGNVFIFENQYMAVEDVTLKRGVKDNTFCGQIKKFDAGFDTDRCVLGRDGSINDVTVDQRLYGVTIGGYWQFSSIGKLSSVNCNTMAYSDVREVSNSLFSHLTRAKMGYANFDLRLYCDDLTLGSNNRQIFISHGNYITIGNSNRNLEFYSFAFSNSSFGDLNRYLRFDGSTVFETSFGTNNGRSGTWLLFHGAVRGLIVGNDCFYLGQSGPFTTTVQNVHLVSNVSRLRITGQFIDCNFGASVSGINCKNCQRVTIGNGTSQITVPNHIYDSTWAAGLNWFVYSGSGNFLKNRVSATHVDFASSTHIMGNYYCDVTARPDGTKRLTYIDDTDNLAVVDVTA